MIKQFALLTGFVLASSTAAFADTPRQQRFTRDGQTYIYTVQERGERRVVDGTSYPSREAFHLVIDGQRVTGTSGQRSVEFDAPTASR